MPTAAPVSLPPAGRMRMATRLRLAAELLSVYATLRPVVATDDLPAMARAARAPDPRRIATPASEHHTTAVRLGAIVGRLFAVLPLDSRCLIRSLVLLSLLDRRSIDASLMIGVKTDGDFGAHAWVEHAGRPVLPTGHVTRLAEF